MKFLLILSVPGVYYAYQNSDSVGKAIVLMLLLGSVATWTTMLDKAISLHRANKASKRFLAMFKSNTRSLVTQSLVREGTGDSGPLGAIYSEGVDKLLEFYEEGSGSYGMGMGRGAVTPVKLSAAQFDAIEAVLERAVSHQIQELEKRIVRSADSSEPSGASCSHSAVSPPQERLTLPPSLPESPELCSPRSQVWWWQSRVWSDTMPSTQRSAT